MTAVAVETERWMPYPATGAAPLTLYCLPHAGAGASAYLPWRKPLGAAIDIVPLQPPGREMRLRETPYADSDALLDDLTAAMRGVWREPFALFGHSMGALIAFELTRRLAADGQPGPVHLFVSGRRAPQRPSQHPQIHTYSDAQLLALIRKLGGTPEVLLADDELREAILRLMRADMAVNEGYRYRPGPPLDIPLTVFGGSGDPHVPVADLEPWTQCGAAEVDLRIVAGGHFFVATERETVLGHVRRRLLESP